MAMPHFLNKLKQDIHNMDKKEKLIINRSFTKFVLFTEKYLIEYLPYCKQNIHHSKIHFHYDNSTVTSCASSHLSYYLTYNRFLTVRDNNQNITQEIPIDVFWCASCKHYHSVLPSFLIVPYGRYSISFMLEVIYAKKEMKLKVDTILSKYSISVSTLYLWCEKFEFYYQLWLRFTKTASACFYEVDDIEAFIEDLNTFPTFIQCSIFQFAPTFFQSTERAQAP